MVSDLGVMAHGLMGERLMGIGFSGTGDIVHSADCDAGIGYCRNGSCERSVPGRGMCTGLTANGLTRNG